MTVLRVQSAVTNEAQLSVVVGPTDTPLQDVANSGLKGIATNVILVLTACAIRGALETEMTLYVHKGTVILVGKLHGIQLGHWLPLYREMEKLGWAGEANQIFTNMNNKLLQGCRAWTELEETTQFSPTFCDTMGSAVDSHNKGIIPRTEKIAQMRWSITDTHPGINWAAAAVRPSFHSTDNSTSDTTNLGGPVVEQALLPNTKNDACWVAIRSRESQSQHMPTEEANGFFHQMMFLVPVQKTLLLDRQKPVLKIVAMQNEYTGSVNQFLFCILPKQINAIERGVGVSTRLYSVTHVGMLVCRMQAFYVVIFVAKNVVLSVDEGYFHYAFVSDRAKRQTVFKKDGTTTTGNSSQVGDGTSAILFMRSSVAE